MSHGEEEGSQSFKTVFKVCGTVDQNGLFRFFIAADKIDDKTVCFNKIKGLKSFLCQIFLKAVLYFVDMLGRRSGYWGKAIQDQGCKIRIFPYRRFNCAPITGACSSGSASVKSCASWDRRLYSCIHLAFREA